MKKKFGKVHLYVALFICICFVCGCGKKVEETSDMSQKVSSFYAGITKEESQNVSKNKDIVVGSVNMGMIGEWFEEVMNGIRDAGSDLGVTVKLLDSNNDLKLEKKNIETLMKEGIDVLVISPINSDESAKALQPVKDAGIPIITWNTTVNMEVTTSVLVNSTALGGDTGDFVAEYVKTNNLKDVKMLILDNKTYDVGVARCDGFRDSIKELIESGTIEIVDSDDAETSEAGCEKIEKMLSEHPETSMIWAWNQNSLLGAIEGAKKANRKDVVIMGTDMSMELASDMLGDEVNLQAVTTQLPYNMGYKAVVNAVKAVNGENPERNVIIPLATYTKADTDLINRYIETHKDLVKEN